MYNLKKFDGKMKVVDNEDRPVRVPARAKIRVDEGIDIKELNAWLTATVALPAYDLHFEGRTRYIVLGGTAFPSGGSHERNGK